MHGDFSRDGFDPSRHFTRVLMQQGRVQLDADWNEQVAIDRHHLRTVLTDLIGQHGGPAGNLALELVVDVAGVDALTGRHGAPLDDGVRETLRDAVRAGDVVLGRGRYYVDGLLCEIDEPFPFRQQIGQPFEPDAAPPQDGDVFLVYLDVWERHVTGVQCPEIREEALGGVDTATRAQLVAQVKILRDGAPFDRDDETDDAERAVDRLRRRHRAALRADARARGRRPDPCVVAPASRYRGAENQLYRVEIHRGGAARGVAATGGATFVWSRENGSVVFPIVAVAGDGSDGTTVTVDGPGRDRRLGPAVGDVVELVDDAGAVSGRPGPLLEVVAFDPDTCDVVVRGAGPDRVAVDLDRRPLLRRWDHGVPADRDAAGALPVVESVSSSDGWIELEDGVCVQFEAAAQGEEPRVYRTGDHWLVPARVASGTVLWPSDGSGEDAVPRFRRADGVHHHYAPLAVARVDGGTVTEVRDCRRAFRPLVDLHQQVEQP